MLKCYLCEMKPCVQISNIKINKKKNHYKILSQSHRPGQQEHSQSVLKSKKCKLWDTMPNTQQRLYCYVVKLPEQFTYPTSVLSSSLWEYLWAERQWVLPGSLMQSFGCCLLHCLTFLIEMPSTSFVGCLKISLYLL